MQKISINHLFKKLCLVVGLIGYIASYSIVVCAQTEHELAIARQYIRLGKFVEAKEILLKLQANSANENDELKSTVYYNLAIVETKLNNIKDAIEYYSKVYKLSPDSRLGQMCLSQIDGLQNDQRRLINLTYQNQNMNPLELTIPVTLTKDDLPQINIKINGHNLTAVFDSGADGFIINKNLADYLGIKLNGKNPTIKVAGSGSHSINNAWLGHVQFQCDMINYKNFEVLVTNDKYPLDPVLGSSCFKNYDYFLDKTNLKLHLTYRHKSKKSKLPPLDKFVLNQDCKYQFSVPFFFDRQNLVVVNAKINDVICPMTLDTGASTSLFTFDQLKKYNLKLDILNDKDSHWGVSGKCQSQTCNIKYFKFGPLAYRNLKATITNQSMAQRPLLGSDVFINYHIQIDKVNNIVTFIQN